MIKEMVAQTYPGVLHLELDMSVSRGPQTWVPPLPVPDSPSLLKACPSTEEHSTLTAAVTFKTETAEIDTHKNMDALWHTYFVPRIHYTEMMQKTTS